MAQPSAKPLKILHVGKYFHPFCGGVENYMRDLMVALARRGITSGALVHRHDRSLTSRTDAVIMGGYDFQVVRAGTWARLLFTPLSPAFPRLLRRMTRVFRPDILHLHLPNPSAFWALLLPSARRIPWVLHWHSDVVTAAQGFMMKLAYAFYRPFEQALLKRAAAIIATSRPYLDTSEPLQPWLAKCRVVPLGLDANRLRLELNPAPNTSVDAPGAAESPGLRILAVGRLTYYKGFQHLIDAAARVENLHVDLVGEGDQECALKARVASLNLLSRVTFHGTVDEIQLARLMSRCDCLCLPSIERTEAFGIVLLEAMNLGKPAVVSDVTGSGMGWVVDHGITGLKVPPGDPSALAEALRTLMAGRERLADMGRASRAKFERMFEINDAVDGIIDTYQTVLAERAPVNDEMQSSDGSS